MDSLKFIVLLLICIAMTGCESLGWGDNVFRDIFTPGASADTRTRHWDENGKPHEQKVQSEPAFLYDAQAEKVQK